MYDRALPPLRDGQPTAWTTWAAHTINVGYAVETGRFEPADTATDTRPNEDAPCSLNPVLPGCLGSGYDFDGYPYHGVLAQRVGAAATRRPARSIPGITSCGRRHPLAPGAHGP
jgi:hypothetical protein